MPDNADATRRFVEDVWNGHREESAHELVADSLPGGPDGVLTWHRDRRGSFPDLRYEIVDIVADGDRVAFRWRATGTQHGAFGPVPATGRAVDYSGATFRRSTTPAESVACGASTSCSRSFSSWARPSPHPFLSTESGRLRPGDLGARYDHEQVHCAHIGGRARGGV